MILSVGLGLKAKIVGLALGFSSQRLEICSHALGLVPVGLVNITGSVLSTCTAWKIWWQKHLQSNIELELWAWCDHEWANRLSVWMRHWFLLWNKTKSLRQLFSCFKIMTKLDKIPNYSCLGLALCCNYILCRCWFILSLLLCTIVTVKFCIRNLEVHSTSIHQYLIMLRRINDRLQEQNQLLYRRDAVWVQHIGMKLLVVLVSHSLIRLSWIGKRWL